MFFYDKYVWILLSATVVCKTFLVIYEDQKIMGNILTFFFFWRIYQLPLRKSEMKFPNEIIRLRIFLCIYGEKNARNRIYE